MNGMIEELKTLLELSGVNQIIYVDDLFNAENYFYDAKAKIRELLEKDDYKQLEFLSGEKEVALDEFESWWWNKASSDDRSDFISNKLKIEVEEGNVLSLLNDLKESGMEIKYMSPQEFQDKYNKGNNENNQVTPNPQVLLLMDKELGGENGHNGLALLNHVGTDNFGYCGLFSGTFKIDEEIEEWKKMDYAPNLYPISKKRIDDKDPNLVIFGIRNILWLCHISKMKNHFESILKEGQKKALARFKQIDPASFDYAVMKKSEKEGCWEYDTIHRILMVMLETEMQNEIMNEGNFSGIQKDLSTLRASSTMLNGDSSSNSSFPWLIQFRKEELYIGGDYINNTFSPIANGDIFEQGNKEYILLCQPCSLSIRENGKRARDLNTAYLLEIKDDGNEKANCEILEESSGSNKKYVNLASALTCNLSVMDLVSYNVEGIAQIDISKEVIDIPDHELIQPNMLQRYSMIKKEMENYLQLYKACEGKQDGQALKAVNYFSKACFRTVPKVNGNEIFFTFKRKCRYNELLAQVLCSKLMNFMARVALPNDLSKPDSNPKK